MTYRLGRHSLRELDLVHPNLVRVVNRAITTTEQDFTVFDGIRGIPEQREYVRRGVSQTMKSKHLPQEDGHGHAVDLVPYINGKLRWEHNACYIIARAMQQAARDEGVKIRWGGAWARLDTHQKDPKLMVKEYIHKRMRQSRPVFIDAPHYEIVL